MAVKVDISTWLWPSHPDSAVRGYCCAGLDNTQQRGCKVPLYSLTARAGTSWNILPSVCQQHLSTAFALQVMAALYEEARTIPTSLLQTCPDKQSSVPVGHTVRFADENIITETLHSASVTVLAALLKQSVERIGRLREVRILRFSTAPLINSCTSNLARAS